MSDDQRPGQGRLARLLGGAHQDRRPLRPDNRFFCPECRSLGFLPSVAGIGHGCTFCDGTVNDEGPDPGVWLHASSGDEYLVVGTALMERDGEAVVIYGRTSELGDMDVRVRPYLEFFDGRFVRVRDQRLPADDMDGEASCECVDSHGPEMARLLHALTALTDPDGKLQGINDGPEKEELQAAYDALFAL